MDYAELEKLERNIKKAIETIHRLQSENQKLKQENEHLTTQIKEKEQTIQQLGHKYQGIGTTEDQSYIYKEKEEKIKQKIQQMLDKLDAFQQFSINRQ